jgi:hypothetical protein
MPQVNSVKSYIVLGLIFMYCLQHYSGQWTVGSNLGLLHCTHFQSELLSTGLHLILDIRYIRNISDIRYIRDIKDSRDIMETLETLDTLDILEI